MNVYESIQEMIGGTPLVRLSGYGRKKKLKAEILAKLEYLNPAGSVKDRVALYMLQDAEKNRDRIKGMLNETQYANDDDAVKMINQLLTDIDVEIAVKRENMQKTFSNNITNVQQYIKEVSAMQSDVGSRMTKLEMIQTRVKEQRATFKELKSQNEDVESEVAITEFNEANLVYNSALAATGNVLKQTLLDYL